MKRHMIKWAALLMAATMFLNTTAAGAAEITYDSVVEAEVDMLIEDQAEDGSAGEAGSDQNDGENDQDENAGEGSDLVIGDEDSVLITEQPQDVCLPVGEKVELSVHAQGDIEAYQWQYSTDDGQTVRARGLTHR